MNDVIIPDIDPIALPAPVWLMQFLSHLTFMLHIIPMNLILGGAILAAVLAWYGKSRDRENVTRLASDVGHVIPAAVAATITLGVPPLLFLQVLYGPLFYTSGVLIAWPWLSVIVLLTTGYYSAYYFSLKRDPDGRLPVAAAVLAATMFVLISFMYSNQMTLMIQPENFAAMHAAGAHGLTLNAGDALMWPRWLHFVVGAIAVSGLLAATIGLLNRKRDTAFSAFAVKLGGLVFVIATIVQMAVGVWQLLALRRDVMLLFMGRDMVATIVMCVAIVFALGATMHILMATRGKSPVRMTITGGGLILLTIILMVEMRAIVRDAYLGERFDVGAQPTDPNWFVVVLFLLLLVVGLGVVGWMLRAVLTRQGANGGAR